MATIMKCGTPAVAALLKGLPEAPFHEQGKLLFLAIEAARVPQDLVFVSRHVKLLETFKLFCYFARRVREFAPRFNGHQTMMLRVLVGTNLVADELKKRAAAEPARRAA